MTLVREMSEKNHVIVKSKKRESRMQIPISELGYANDELTFNAHKLFLYYYSKDYGWYFTDPTIEKVLNFSLRTLQNARKELIDKNFLLIINGKVVNYFIGKAAVLEQLNYDTETQIRKGTFGNDIEEEC